MFTCKTERPATRVTWRKGLMELRASGKHTPSQEGLTLTLTINSLEKADSDTYICDIGQARTQARLMVQGEVQGQAPWKEPNFQRPLGLSMILSGNQ